MSCPKFRSELRRSGFEPPGPELTRHLERCARCRDEASLYAFFRQLDAEPGARPSDEATRLWHRAQVVRRLVDGQRREQRALRPVLLGQPLALALAVVAASLIGLTILSSQVFPAAEISWAIPWLLGLLPFVLGLPATALLLLGET